jgi:hypothetical protein
MVYKAVKNKNGLYMDIDSTLFNILEATNVMTPQGKNVGWDEYASIEEAAKSFGLTYIGEQDNDEIVDLLNVILSEEVNK